jgi:hypothetical protein
VRQNLLIGANYSCPERNVPVDRICFAIAIDVNKEEDEVAADLLSQHEQKNSIRACSLGLAF